MIESEGGKGLASLAAAAAEEADAATQALARLDEEAATVKMLKDVLDEARAQASRTFVGPVAQRARVHVERLFPGADLTFAEELGLASVTSSSARQSVVSGGRGAAVVVVGGSCSDIKKTRLSIT